MEGRWKGTWLQPTSYDQVVTFQSNTLYGAASCTVLQSQTKINRGHVGGGLERRVVRTVKEAVKG